MAETADVLPGEWPSPDEDSAAAVAARARAVLRPTGALAALDDLAVWLARWQGTPKPAVEKPAAVVFVADHGVAAEGVSAYPADVTVAMLAALRKGVATAAAMARAAGVSLTVVDIGTGRPTGNITVEAALSPARFAEAWDAGVAAVHQRDADLLVLGEMGIGNTTAAAAVAATLFGGPAADWAGRGTGIDDAALARKIDVVERARGRVPDTADAFEVLRITGGAELVAIAGALAAARARPMPVLLDGYVVTAAAAVLHRARPGAVDHCRAAHLSPEPGHARLLEELGQVPLLDLGMRLGEASGALAAVPLVRLAAAAVVEVATFDEWG